MRKLILSLAILVSSTALLAQKAEFSKETIDFGKIKQNEPKTATFVVKNVGTTPLIIETATPTCGCTIGDYTKSPIAPGKEGWIKATYDAKAMGAFTKSMSVKFAGVDQPKNITFTGEVLAADAYAKLTGGKTVTTTKTDGNKTKTVTKTNGVKTSKTKIKTEGKPTAAKS